MDLFTFDQRKQSHQVYKEATRLTLSTQTWLRHPNILWILMYPCCPSHISTTQFLFGSTCVQAKAELLRWHNWDLCRANSQVHTNKHGVAVQAQKYSYKCKSFRSISRPISIAQHIWRPNLLKTLKSHEMKETLTVLQEQARSQMVCTH